MEDTFPALATALAAVIGALAKAWWERREKQKLLLSVKTSTPEPAQGKNGWTHFATMIVTNLLREKEAQKAAFEAKIAELEFENEAKDRTIQQQHVYIATLRTERREGKDE